VRARQRATRRILDAIEAALQAGEIHLTSMFAIFTRLSPTRLVTRTRPARLERIHPAPEPAGRPSAASRRAIDLGCGAGRHAVPLNRKYLRDSVRSR
jgi:hypothetical protein